MTFRNLYAALVAFFARRPRHYVMKAEMGLFSAKLDP